MFISNTHTPALCVFVCVYLEFYLKIYNQKITLFKLILLAYSLRYFLNCKHPFYDFNHHVT